MRILAMETTVAGVREAQFTPEIAAAEARRAWDLQQAGTIRELYFRADSAAAVLVVECVGCGRGGDGSGVSTDGGCRADQFRSTAAAGLSRVRAALRSYRSGVTQGRTPLGPGI